MGMRGTLYGVGVGPGDPELMSLKAVRILKSVPVVAFFAKKGAPGNARRAVDGHLNPEAELVRLDYPFTTELPESDTRGVLRRRSRVPCRAARSRPGRGRALRRRSLLLRFLCASA
jgi:precorrin-2 methylase